MTLDRETLWALRPLELAAYLRSRGWREVGHVEDKASVWTARRGSTEAEVLLPLDPTLGDYLSRMAEVVSTLEAFEARSRWAVLADVAAANADTLRLRFSGPSFEGSSVTLTQGVRIHEHARELLLAAACAAVEPRPVFSTRKPARALDYLQAVRLSPPERGSYVVTVRSPVPPALLSGRAAGSEASEEPFERQVVAMLAGSLAGAHRAAIRAASTAASQPFYDEVPVGVSANLCEALAGLIAESGARMFEVTVSPAPNRPGLEERSVAFSSDAAPLLREAARVFRASAPREDFELEGVVIQLKRDEGAAGGSVTVAGIVDADLRRVRLALGAPEYAVAIEAHRTGAPVRCEGELAREGRAYVLRNPRLFAMKAGDRGE